MVRAPSDTIYHYRFEAPDLDSAWTYARECEVLKDHVIMQICELGDERPDNLGELIPFWR